MNRFFRAFIFLLFSVSCLGQPQAILDKTTYNFWLNEPKEQSGKMPLIVFLHGRSLSGNDINRVKRYGALKGIEKGLDIPAYLVAPQLPSGAWNPAKDRKSTRLNSSHVRISYAVFCLKKKKKKK